MRWEGSYGVWYSQDPYPWSETHKWEDIHNCRDPLQAAKGSKPHITFPSPEVLHLEDEHP